MWQMLRALEDSQLSLWISESTWAFQAIETVHVSVGGSSAEETVRQSKRARMGIDNESDQVE